MQRGKYVFFKYIIILLKKINFRIEKWDSLLLIFSEHFQMNFIKRNHSVMYRFVMENRRSGSYKKYLQPESDEPIPLSFWKKYKHCDQEVN